MVEVKDHSNQVLAQYTFDPYGRRLSKTVSGVTTFFYYTADGLAGEYNASGGLIKEYGFKPGGTWTTDPLFMRTGGQIYYYHNNHLGQPLKLFDKTGQVVWSAESESFGATTVSVNAVENNLRLPGQYFDGETGLHYNYFRDYDPGLGRYVQSDPLGIFDGPNTYAYVGGNPLSYVDPTGEFGVPGAVFGAVLGGVCAALNPENNGFDILFAASSGLLGGLSFGLGLSLDLGYESYKQNQNRKEAGNCDGNNDSSDVRDLTAIVIANSAGDVTGKLVTNNTTIQNAKKNHWVSPADKNKGGVFGGLISCATSLILKKPQVEQ